MLGITMKTHDFELFLTSGEAKGFSAGLTVGALTYLIASIDALQ